jgi:hypothetical protein
MYSSVQIAFGQGPNSSGEGAPRFRRLAGLAFLTATLALGACGGGGDGGGGGGSASANIGIGVTVEGQPSGNLLVAPGGSVDLAVRAGDSVILQAPEPVVWTLLVGGTAVRTGVEVFYAGVFITATTLDSFSVAVDTFADFAPNSPVPITLIADSTFDSAPIATVNILITR